MRSSFESCSAALVPVAAHARVQELGERLGQAVGERLDHDRAVVVVLGLVAARELVGAGIAVTAKAPRWSPSGATKSARQRVRAPIRRSLACWRSIGKRRRRRARRRRPRARPARSRSGARACSASAATISSSSAVASSKSSRAAGLLEDLRELALQLPREEEERPVDVGARASRASGSSVAHAGEAGAARSIEVELLGVPARVGERQERPALLLGVLTAQALLQRSRLSTSSTTRRSASSRSETTPTTREASSTCTVGRLYSGAIRTAVCWRDVVAPPIRSGRCEPAALHLLRDVHHLVERRRDQPREADRSRSPPRRPSRGCLSAGTMTPRSITS